MSSGAAAGSAGAATGASGPGKGPMIVSAIKAYFDRMVADQTGMKALLVDDETLGIASIVYSQSQILEKEVVLVERLGVTHERMHHLKAACFLRPTDENVRKLRRELSDPKFGEYHIYFSNIVRQDLLQTIAEADEQEMVKSVQEYYADYLAVNEDFFTLNLANSLSLSVPRPRWSTAQQAIFNRSCEGVLSVLLSLKKRAVVRYQASSDLATMFAREASNRMDRENTLFDFPRSGPPALLLVMDRREDPVTPLLSQWTYQAMVHELLTLANNRVSLAHVPSVKEEIRQCVLSQDQDPFFHENMLSNFGDLGVAVKEMLERYTARSRAAKKMDSIQDMQRFVEEYPEFRKASTDVSKHVAIMSELARIVDQEALMDVSALEQELACSSDQSGHAAELRDKLGDRRISNAAALRLVMLFALRYETSGRSQVEDFKVKLRERGMSQHHVRLVDTVLQYGGSSVRGNDLFGTKTLAAKMMKTLKREIKGVNNVYTQHKPYLAEVLEAATRGKLRESEFAFVSGGGRERPREVFVFMVGGATYEEAALVSQLNAQNEAGVRYLLGGTFVHNSRTFLDELSRMAGGPAM